MSGLLEASLEASVGIRIAELIREPAEERWAELEARREEWVELIASKGDALMFGGRPGEAAAAHAALSNALAHLAFAPGGVTFAGLHFQVELG